MPKVVDHAERRRELAGAVWRVIAHDGVAGVSMRTVAAESGWSSGALRHYFATRDELLAFACEQVIERVTERIAALPIDSDPRVAVRRVLLELVPADADRHTEASIGFAFLALGLNDPALAAVQREMFTGLYELCCRLICHLRPDLGEAELRTHGRRLHAVVDGLTVHVLAGHLSAEEMVGEVDAYLSEISPR